MLLLFPLSDRGMNHICIMNANAGGQALEEPKPWYLFEVIKKKKKKIEHFAFSAQGRPSYSMLIVTVVTTAFANHKIKNTNRNRQECSFQLLAITYKQLRECVAWETHA